MVVLGRARNDDRILGQREQLRVNRAQDLAAVPAGKIGAADRIAKTACRRRSPCARRVSTAKCCLAYGRAFRERETPRRRASENRLRARPNRSRSAPASPCRAIPPERPDCRTAERRSDSCRPARRSMLLVSPRRRCGRYARAWMTIAFTLSECFASIATDFVDIIAGIDHDGFARLLVSKNRAVALQHSDRQNLVDHHHDCILGL